MGRPRKRWIDTVKECLKKSGLNIRQARRMTQDRNEWRGFVKGNAWGVARRIAIRVYEGECRNSTIG